MIIDICAYMTLHPYLVNLFNSLAVNNFLSNRKRAAVSHGGHSETEHIICRTLMIFSWGI